MRLLLHKGKIYLKTGTFDNANIPIVVVFKALGMESDLEMFKLVGGEKFISEVLFYCLEESTLMKINT